MKAPLPARRAGRTAASRASGSAHRSRCEHRSITRARRALAGDCAFSSPPPDPDSGQTTPARPRAMAARNASGNGTIFHRVELDHRPGCRARRRSLALSRRRSRQVFRHEVQLTQRRGENGEGPIIDFIVKVLFALRPSNCFFGHLAVPWRLGVRILFALPLFLRPSALKIAYLNGA